MIDEMRVYVEDLIPNIESFLESRDGLVAPSKFVRLDPLTYQQIPLNFSWRDGKSGEYKSVSADRGR